MPSTSDIDLKAQSSSTSIASTARPAYTARSTQNATVAATPFPSPICKKCRDDKMLGGGIVALLWIFGMLLYMMSMAINLVKESGWWLAGVIAIWFIPSVLLSLWIKIMEVRRAKRNKEGQKEQEELKTRQENEGKVRKERIKDLKALIEGTKSRIEDPSFVQNIVAMRVRRENYLVSMLPASSWDQEWIDLVKEFATLIEVRIDRRWVLTPAKVVTSFEDGGSAAIAIALTPGIKDETGRHVWIGQIHKANDVLLGVK